MSLRFGKPAITLGGTISKFYNKLTWNLDVSYLKFQSYKYQNSIVTKFGDEFRTNLALIYRVYFNKTLQFRFDSFLENNYLKIFSDKENKISSQDKLIFIANQNGIFLSNVNNEIVNKSIVFSTISSWQYETLLEEILFASTIPESNLTDVLYSSLGIATEPGGGEIDYLTTGFCIYYKNISFSFVVKLPIYFITNNLIISLTREQIKEQFLEREPDFASVFWKYQVLEEDLYQGSESKEKYRFLLSFLY